MVFRWTWLLALAVLLAGGWARAQPCESEAHVSAARAAIAQVWASYEATRNANDLPGWLALWDESGVAVPADGELLAGTEAMASSLGSTTEDSVLNIRPGETEVFGPWAYSRGSYTLEVLDPRGGVLRHAEGTFLSVFRQQPDGGWKLYRYVENEAPLPD